MAKKKLTKPSIIVTISDSIFDDWDIEEIINQYPASFVEESIFNLNSRDLDDLLTE